MEDSAQKHFSKLHFKPTFGSIEVEDESFILMRAESLSSEIYSVMLDLFGPTQSVESTDLAHEFAINFIYDFGRSLGQSDQQLFSSKIFPTKDPMQLKAGVTVNMASTGWGTGSIFSAYGDVPTTAQFSSEEHYFMIGIRCWNTFESDAWRHLYSSQKAPAPHCLLAAAYVSGWCESNFKVPLIGVEVECDAMKLSSEEDHCDFIVAHPNQVEHFVRYYTEHQRNRRDPSETHLELLAKTRSLRNRTRPGMGNWLKKIIERETSLVTPPAEATGQLIGAPKPQGEETTATSDEDSVLKADSRKGSKSSIKRSRHGSNAGSPTSPGPVTVTASAKKRPPLVSSRKSLDISRNADIASGSEEKAAAPKEERSTGATKERNIQMSPGDSKAKHAQEEPKLHLSKAAEKKDSVEEKPISKSDVGKK